jgi:micrococcal nuclease
MEEAVVAPEPAPAPAAKAAAKKASAAKRNKAPAKAWVEPKGSVCPTSHPVKAKLSSKIFHLPGMLNYERTNPDRCYADAKKAEADGLRPAKR